MSWRTNKLVVLLRNVGRRIGINRYISVLLNGAGYEARYDKAFLNHINPGDCVWDVGANIGYYTSMFAEKVGSNGSVVAFEPSPINFKRLKINTSEFKNVRLFNLGLGEVKGALPFTQGEDALGATSRVAMNDESSVYVDIERATDLLESGRVTLPNAIKIDVEGFELEVLHGLADYLGSKTLRVIGIEVHFSILKERNMQLAPNEIEKLLFAHGFQISWADASHLIGSRVMQ